ncbi:MAG: serine/threonine-protein kinase [Planctomycetota bacterium]
MVDPSIAKENWVGVELCAGRYRVTEQLGSGGMAFVYRAHDGRLESDVVLKVPRRAMLTDPAFVERFRAEIRSLVKLRHPHVVSVLDVDEHEGIPFAVMQLLSGGTLLDRFGKASVPEILRGLNQWLPEIAKAIDFLHKQGFIHRDIKPENILFDEHSHAFLSDFGVVKTVLAEQQGEGRALTQNGILGTPEYMAPEMILGQDFDGAVDQYALGVTVYELLAKRRPFEAETGTAVLVAHTRDEPPPLDTIIDGLPPDFISTLHRAMAKNPTDRFVDCESFCREMIQRLKPVEHESRDTRHVTRRSETTFDKDHRGHDGDNETSASSEQNLNSSKQARLRFVIAAVVAALVFPLWVTIGSCVAIVWTRHSQLLPDFLSKYLDALATPPAALSGMLTRLGAKDRNIQWGILFVATVAVAKLLADWVGLASWLRW